MLPTPTVDKLHGLKLPTMAQAWTEQQRTAELHALSLTSASACSSMPSGSPAKTNAWPAPSRRPSSSSPRRASRRSTTRPGASSTKPWSGNSPPAAGSRNTTT